MKIQFDSNFPIYQQIISHFKNEIAKGTVNPGDKILPVRELASQLEVNPNTLQKALAELEKQNILYTERTSGRYVTKDVKLIAMLRKELCESCIKEFIESMALIGIKRDELPTLLKKYIEEEVINE